MRTHGKIGTYSDGCRCEDCRRVSAEKRNAHRRRQLRSDATPRIQVDWSAAACAGLDPDLFHPTRGENATQAKAVCRACPVRAECLAWAVANHEHFGIWGGRSERERRQLHEETSR